MIGYSAKKEGDRLFGIIKKDMQMLATDASKEYKIDARGDWFFFVDNLNFASYEALKQVDDGAIVKLNNDFAIIKAFNQAISLNSTEAQIIPLAIETPTEAQEQIKDAIQEKIIIQPIIQPIQTQAGDTMPIVWAATTAEPVIAEIITPAEEWAVRTIAQPLIALGIKVYNDNIPQNEVRPREYVILIVDEEIRDVGFADNQNYKEESLITLIIQGQGNTFENWVVEISKHIHDILRQERKNSKVQNITNRNIGFDETTKILSRSITAWYRYATK